MKLNKKNKTQLRGIALVYLMKPIKEMLHRELKAKFAVSSTKPEGDDMR